MRKLWYGDNLQVMARYMSDESVDLIYLDPPFNSKRDYNVLFKDQSGLHAPAQMKAFGDTWNWADAEETDYHNSTYAGGAIAKYLDTIIDIHGKNSLTAYLVMMTVRLIEMRRVLKDTGSIYLHCDPTASHYLKTIMDVIFGAKNFKNEIIWHYHAGSSPKMAFKRKHDIIFFYTKSDNYTFNQPHMPYAEKDLHRFNRTDEEGKKYRINHTKDKDGNMKRFYLDKGTAQDDVFSYVRDAKLTQLGATAKERLGYPTQKPVALLERIIKASSNEGDIVFDPFCGCGTTIAAAETLGRSWIGIDITHLAVNLQKDRLLNNHGLKPGKGKNGYIIRGMPTTKAAAWDLFKTDPHEFESWVVDLLEGEPSGSQGADGGIDGTYTDDSLQRTIIQVKGGKHPDSVQIRNLGGVISSTIAWRGVFVCFKDYVSKAMIKEAGKFRTVPHGDKHHPKIEIITVEDLIAGKRLPK